MKLAVLSDTHDNIENVGKAIDIIGKQQTDAIIHILDTRRHSITRLTIS